MKKTFILVMLVFMGIGYSFAQPETVKPEVAYPVYFDVSPPLRDMIKLAPGKADNSWKNGIVKNKFRDAQTPDSQVPASPQSSAQDYYGSTLTDTTIQNFDGISNASGYNPPDTHGDVGLNHYFQVVNCSYAIYSKTGVKLLGPSANSSMWNGMPNNSNDGDAVVLYDELADRWIFTQFSLPHYPSGPYYEMIAVSQTPDPTGSWYRWEYSYDKMPDYPKFGIWPDGYYMSCNRFSNGSSFAGIGADAYDRTAMLAGDANAARISFTLSSGNEAFTAIPADCDGAFPPVGTPEYFTYIKYNSSQHLGILEFHADWATPTNSTFGNLLSLQVDPFNSSLSAGLPQKNTSVKVPAITDRLMYRVQFRTFNGYNAMVLNHVVNAGSGVAGIRWYELRRTDTDPWSIYQQSTYAPGDGNSRWMGSIAMDSAGNIALGFSITGSTMYPSIHYTGRMNCDTLGVMTIAEKSIINGTGAQTATGDYSRWGDYSAMSCDPSSQRMFWYTQEYYASTSQMNWKTRIGSFSFFTAYAAAAPQLICAGDSAQLSAVANCGAAGNYTYSWTSNPAGFSSTEAAPKVAPDSTTDYILVISDGNNTRTDTITVNVQPAPVVSAGADTTVCWYVTSIPVHGTATNILSMLWTTSGTGTFTTPVTFNTDYQPTLEDKLAGSVDLLFTGNPMPPCTQGVTSTKHVVFDQCTGMENKNNEPLLLIRPNPAHNMVNIGISGILQGSYTLAITSMDGKVMFTENGETTGSPVMKHLDVSGFTKGIYVVRLTAGNQVLTQKLAVQ